MTADVGAVPLVPDAQRQIKVGIFPVFAHRDEHEFINPRYVGGEGGLLHFNL